LLKDPLLWSALTESVVARPGFGDAQPKSITSKSLELGTPMALIACSECAAQLPDKASACIKCGAPVPQVLETAKSKPAPLLSSAWVILSGQQSVAGANPWASALIPVGGAVIVLCLVIFLVVLRGRSAAPEAEVQFVNSLSELQRQWEANSSNEIAKSAVERRARAFWGTPVTAAGWIGTVESVSTMLGDSWATVIFHDDGWEDGTHTVMFKLWVSSSPSPVLAILREGNEVRFSGTVAGEMSLTIAGAMADPKIKIKPLESVEKL
jgi:hypothetical protein